MGQTGSLSSSQNQANNPYSQADKNSITHLVFQFVCFPSVLPQITVGIFIPSHARQKSTHLIFLD